jgi:hypothetical protein
VNALELKWVSFYPRHKNSIEPEILIAVSFVYSEKRFPRNSSSEAAWRQHDAQGSALEIQGLFHFLSNSTGSVYGSEIWEIVQR